MVAATIAAALGSRTRLWMLTMEDRDPGCRSALLAGSGTDIGMKLSRPGFAVSRD